MVLHDSEAGHKGKACRRANIAFQLLLLPRGRPSASSPAAAEYLEDMDPAETPAEGEEAVAENDVAADENEAVPSEADLPPSPPGAIAASQVRSNSRPS